MSKEAPPSHHWSHSLVYLQPTPEPVLPTPSLEERLSNIEARLSSLENAVQTRDPDMLTKLQELAGTVGHLVTLFTRSPRDTN